MHTVLHRTRTVLPWRSRCWQALGGCLCVQVVCFKQCSFQMAKRCVCHAGAEEHILLQYFSSRAIRRLILTASAENKHATDFSSMLWEAAFQGKCRQWLGTHAEKILAALASCCDNLVKNALNTELQPVLKKDVAEWAAEFVLQGKSSVKRQQASKQEKP